MIALSWQDRLDRSALLRSAASLCRERREFSRAKESLEQALSVLKDCEEPDAIAVVKVLHDLGSLEELQDNLVQAEAYFLEALEVCETSLGPLAIGTASRLNHLACLYRRKNDLSKTVELLVRSLEIYEERLGSVNKPAALMRFALAVLYRRHGNIEEADTYRAVLNGTTNLLPSSSRKIESALKLSREDSAKKRKSTVDLKRFGIIPGDSNDFPEFDFVIETVLGGADGKLQDSWEDAAAQECRDSVKLLDRYLNASAKRNGGPLETYEENSDGTLTVVYGSQSTSKAMAQVRLRISASEEPGLQCRAVENANWKEGAAWLPASLVPAPLQEELFRGARVAFFDMSIENGGLNLEFIEAFFTSENMQANAYRNAGWIAMANWSKANKIPIKEDSRSGLWLYPPIM